MTRHDARDQYRPSPLAEATVRQEDGRWTLVFIRHFAHSPEAVWAALTDPEELREWAPFDAPRSLAALGPVTLVMAGEGGEPAPAVVRVADPPTLLEFSWAEDLLRWELTPTPTGTRLTLSHTVTDRGWLAKVGAGWHICLDVAERWLAGAPLGRIVANDAKRHGWESLNTAYAERFKVEP